MTWPTVSLGDHTDLLTGFPFKSADFTADPGGIRLLRGANVAQARLDWSDMRRLPPGMAEGYRDYQLQLGDVILAMDRPWIEAGLKYAWTTADDLPTLLVQRVSRIRGSNGLLTDYLRYVIGSPGFTNYIAPIVTGVNVPHISPTQIRGFRLPLPPALIQRKIAAMLSAYDDLIENNTRRIKVLEDMAQRIYREWFVDFRCPGHETVPLVDSRLGLIPEGWAAGVLDDLLVLQRGFDLPTSQREEGQVPVIAATGQHGSHSVAKVLGPGVVTGRSGSLGHVEYVDEDFWPLNTTLWVKEFRKATPETAYFLLRELNLGGFNSGAAVPTLNRNDIGGVPQVLPPRILVDAFSDIARTFLAKRRNLGRSQLMLRATRDLLLPRLISGEIDVEDLNIAVPDATA